MDTIPVETLQRIFEFACTDGGSTGNSISRVSKRFRAIGRTTRFQSVLLAASPRRLQSFVALYEHECDLSLGDKPRIRHLHITFPCSMRTGRSRTRARIRSISPSARNVDSPTPSRREHTHPQPGRATAQADSIPAVEEYCDPTTTPEYQLAARTLFHLVASDLVTLVVQCGFSKEGVLNLPIFGERSFPCLREATFVGIEDTRSLFEGEEHSMATAPHQPRFPALTHLTLMPTTYTSSLRTSLWSANAPHVTHLSISSADRHARELALLYGVTVNPHWYEVLEFDSDSDPEDPQARLTIPVDPRPSPLWPSVRSLLLQPGPRPVQARCGNVIIQYCHGVVVLKMVARSAVEAGVDALVIAAPQPGQYAVRNDRARQVWLERVDDGGCGAAYWGEMLDDLGKEL
ncbi:hypothetical protein C8Q77DRAFT_394159 [Trametes polyzona]|nr:hypothetical protein C8Q77DRAFT_394159 [Trametes polyzona]